MPQITSQDKTHMFYLHRSGMTRSQENGQFGMITALSTKTGSGERCMFYVTFEPASFLIFLL
jgi:hypothetical protein